MSTELPGELFLLRFHSRELRAQRAKFGAQSASRQGFDPSRPSEHLQLDFTVPRSRTQLRGAADECLSLLVETMTPDFLLHDAQVLLGLDESLFRFLQLLLVEERAVLCASETASRLMTLVNSTGMAFARFAAN